MDEMHTPADFTKSITVFGIIQCTIYTLTGALIYAFVGQDVQSPALLSAGPMVAKIAFGIALPVIYISGSINTTVACRFIHGRMYQDSITRYINTRKGWATWIIVVSFVTFFSLIIAEAIPFFSELLSLTGCLFVAGLSFYIPPIMWFCLLKEGKWYERHNLRPAIASLIVFIVGFTVFGIGTYASVVEIVSFYSSLFLVCRHLTWLSDEEVRIRFNQPTIFVQCRSLSLRSGFPTLVITTHPWLATRGHSYISHWHIIRGNPGLDSKSNEGFACHRD
jgi:hypothetical protein